MQSYDVGAPPEAVAIGNFVDGRAVDLAVGTVSGVVSVLQGKGDGTFLPPQTVYTGSFISALAAGDFNEDHRLDLAFLDGLQLVVLLNNGDGAFTTSSVIPSEFGRKVVVADFDGDHTTDLAVMNQADDMAVYLGKGNGTFQPPQRFGAGVFVQDVVVSDLNRDGAQDFAVLNFFSGDVSVLLNTTGAQECRPSR